MAVAELEKLNKYLVENGYDVTKKCISKLLYDINGLSIPDYNQLVVTYKDSDLEWDVVCHPGSYGWEERLLESYHMLEDEGDVTGFLTADDVIERLESR